MSHSAPAEYPCPKPVSASYTDGCRYKATKRLPEQGMLLQQNRRSSRCVSKMQYSYRSTVTCGLSACRAKVYVQATVQFHAFQLLQEARELTILGRSQTGQQFYTTVQCSSTKFNIRLCKKPPSQKCEWLRRSSSIAGIVYSLHTVAEGRVCAIHGSGAIRGRCQPIQW